jgi:hypothetical protein
MQSQHPHQPTSEKRQAANRANAQHCTGPRTPQGKFRSSKNAQIHGGFALSTLLAGEDPNAFFNFRRDWLIRLAPQDCPELFLAERAVSLAWRLHRIQQSDSDLYQASQTQFDNTFKQAQETLKKHRATLSPGELKLLNLPTAPAFPPSLTLAGAYESNSSKNPFERLSITEERFQGMLDRTMKQFHRLQKQRQDSPPQPCPFVPEEEPKYIEPEELYDQPPQSPAAPPTPAPSTPARQTVPSTQNLRNEPNSLIASPPPRFQTPADPVPFHRKT